MQKRNVLNSPRLAELKKSRRREFENKILVCLLALAILLGFFSYFSHLPILNISEVQVSGNNVVDTKSVQDVVNKEISGSYSHLFPRTNIFIYPENKIKAELIKDFPRLETVNLSIKKDKILQVDVVERSPKYAWCGATIPDVANGSPEKCYFMDDNGYIFDTAPFFSGQIYFKFYGKTDMTGDDPAGSTFALGLFAKLIQFKDTLAGMNLKPTSLNFEDTGDIEINLSSSAVAGATHPKIIFNEDEDFQTIAENLDSALSTDPLMSLFKNKYSTLEYIDLRYGNKVYYKFN